MAMVMATARHVRYHHVVDTQRGRGQRQRHVVFIVLVVNRQGEGKGRWRQCVVFVVVNREREGRRGCFVVDSEREREREREREDVTTKARATALSLSRLAQVIAFLHCRPTSASELSRHRKVGDGRRNRWWSGGNRVNNCFWMQRPCRGER